MFNKELVERAKCNILKPTLLTDCIICEHIYQQSSQNTLIIDTRYLIIAWDTMRRTTFMHIEIQQLSGNRKQIATNSLKAKVGRITMDKEKAI